MALFLVIIGALRFEFFSSRIRCGFGPFLVVAVVVVVFRFVVGVGVSFDSGLDELAELGRHRRFGLAPLWMVIALLSLLLPLMLRVIIFRRMGGV